MLMGVAHGEEWLDVLGLPYLCVAADGRVAGTLAPAGAGAA